MGALSMHTEAVFLLVLHPPLVDTSNETSSFQFKSLDLQLY